MEGARDTVRLKVVDVLMGRPVVGETLDLNHKTYFLTGRIEMPFVSQSAWYGTMELPAVALPTD